MLNVGTHENVYMDRERAGTATWSETSLRRDQFTNTESPEIQNKKLGSHEIGQLRFNLVSLLKQLEIKNG